MSTLTNTTQKELVAIVSCAMKAQNKYKDETTQEQVEIVRAWARKWFENKKKSNEGARKWNKEHPERHRKTNLEYYYRNRDKVKEYQKRYYEEVLKPKRQAQKERKKECPKN